VTPRIVSSPSIFVRPSSAGRSAVGRNVISGCRSASKNSGSSTLARIAAGSTAELESTRADPSSVAATSDSEARYQKTPEWSTANAKLEGTGWAW
jgi:hypothetical protein